MANKAIKCGKMFDSTTGAVRENMVIFTDGERIASVVPAAEANCDGYEVIDLGDTKHNTFLNGAYAAMSIK